MNGFPTGTTYKHACQGCGRNFTILSIWNKVMHSLGALVLFAVAAFYLVTTGFTMTNEPLTKQPIFFAGLGLLASLLYCAWIVWKSLETSRNPLLGKLAGTPQQSMSRSG